MRTSIAAAALILLGAYMACGLVFTSPFVLLGVKSIDPHATHIELQKDERSELAANIL